MLILIAGAIGRPDELGRRLARNTHVVLLEESHLARVADPGGGSYYVESLTESLAQEAWRRFQAVEAAGGMVEALTSGRAAAEVAQAWQAELSLLATRRHPLVGVSEFPSLDEAPVQRPAAPTAVAPARAFPLRRLAAPFEALRDAADAAEPAPTIYLANLGPVATHTARAGFAKNLFEVGGIRALPYFAHMQTALFGKPVMISRTGYTGERGYEVFCRGQDAPMIWDRILDDGAAMGIIPCRFTTLDLLRTESCLLFFPFDNSEMYPFADQGPGDTLWELGLDFTVSPGKTGFRGAEEHLRLKGHERFRIWGLKLAGQKAPGNGAAVLRDGVQVGVVTQAMHSDLNQHTVAIARLPADCATTGTLLVVACDTHGEIAATTHPMPFYDTEKKRRTAQG